MRRICVSMRRISSWILLMSFLLTILLFGYRFSPYMYFWMTRLRFRPFVSIQSLSTLYYFTCYFGLYMLLTDFIETLMFCYFLWHMKLIYLSLVTMEVHLFTITYYLSMYDLYMSQIFVSTHWLVVFNMISNYYGLLCMF